MRAIISYLSIFSAGICTGMAIAFLLRDLYIRRLEAERRRWKAIAYGHLYGAGPNFLKRAKAGFWYRLKSR